MVRRGQSWVFGSSIASIRALTIERRIPSTDTATRTDHEALQIAPTGATFLDRSRSDCKPLSPSLSRLCNRRGSSRYAEARLRSLAQRLQDSCRVLIEEKAQPARLDAPIVCSTDDTLLEEHAKRVVSIRNLPKTFPGLVSFPVITVIEEVQTP